MGLISLQTVVPCDAGEVELDRCRAEGRWNEIPALVQRLLKTYQQSQQASSLLQGSSSLQLTASPISTKSQPGSNPATQPSSVSAVQACSVNVHALVFTALGQYAHERGRTQDAITNLTKALEYDDKFEVNDGCTLHVVRRASVTIIVCCC